MCEALNNVVHLFLFHETASPFLIMSCCGCTRKHALKQHSRETLLTLGHRL